MNDAMRGPLMGWLLAGLLSAPVMLPGMFFGVDAAALDGSPTGMVSFFPLSRQQGCPSGWSEYRDASGDYAARGRFLLAVTDLNGYELGKTVGTPYADQYLPPTHSHNFETDVALSSHGCSCTKGCCGFKGATPTSHDVPKTQPGKTADGDSALSYTQLLVCEKDPPSGSAGTDTYPQFSLAFFDSKACPTGWETAKAPGSTSGITARMLMPFYNAKSDIGNEFGTHLNNGEAWAHSHSFASSISFGNSDIQADSGSGGGIARGNQSYDFSGTTGSTSVNLPYVQLLLCEKTVGTNNIAPLGLPQKILLFFNESYCPSGWVTTPTGTGRLLLGLPEDGTPNQTVGANVIETPGDPITHTHKFSGSVGVGSQQVAELSGCSKIFGEKILCDEHHASTGDRSFSGTSGNSAQLPYLAVNLCQPDT